MSDRTSSVERVALRAARERREITFGARVGIAIGGRNVEGTARARRGAGRDETGEDTIVVGERAQVDVRDRGTTAHKNIQRPAS